MMYYKLIEQAPDEVALGKRLSQDGKLISVNTAAH
jgi:hypothetical protein